MKHFYRPYRIVRSIAIRGGFGFIAAGMLCAFNVPAHAQSAGSILVISQRNDSTPSETFVDLAPHLESSLRESGKYDAVIFRPDNPSIKALIDSKALDPSDIKPPLSRAAAHKIGQALNARYILTVSAQSTKEGIAADAETEAALGLGQWSTLSAEKILPARTRGRARSLLESVHVVVAGLMAKIDAAVASGPRPAPPKPDQPRVSDTPGEKAQPSPNITTTPPVDKGATRASDKGNPAGGTSNPSNSNPGAKAANLPSTYEILVAKARKNGDMANLLVALKRAVTERPRELRLRKDLIQAYNDRGWHDEARDEAIRAVDLAPNDAALHRLIGEALLDSGDTVRALAEFNKAIELGPRDAANVIALGDAQWNTGKPDDALKTYESAAKLDPKSPLPPRRLARLYGIRGRYAECLAAMTTAKSLVAADDIAGLREDNAALLGGVDSTLVDILARLQVAKKDFTSGIRNREEAHTEVSKQRKKAEDLSTFLDALPDAGLGRVQALYLQAATLVGQSAEKLLDFLETQSTSQEEESSLLRIEAKKQIDDAGKTLRALLAAKK